jgi:protein involved in polysaccharide export with SLBB domain
MLGLPTGRGSNSAMSRSRFSLVKTRIAVVGLLPADVEAAIAAQLTKDQILVDPIVIVSVVESRSRPIVVSGAVKKPITFQASGQTTLLDAIARAEGLSLEAGPDPLGLRGRRTRVYEVDSSRAGAEVARGGGWLLLW